MRSTLIFFIFLLPVIWSSCSDDFDLTSDWKDIPIVYAVFDLNDETHYIRIEKAFLDPNRDATEIAQIPDSLYYQNLDVRVKKGTQEFILQEVNAEEEGLIREDGIFATSPNILYKIDGETLDLEEGDALQLIINRGDNTDLITAQTTVVGPSELRDPNTEASLSFASPNGTTIKWKPDDFSVIFDLRFILHLIEFPTADPGDLTVREIEWIVDKSVPRGEQFNVQLAGDDAVQGQNFFSLLKANLEVNPEITRVFSGVDVVVTGAGQSLGSFIEIINANTGVTSAQEIPIFTNLSEGRGIFGSRSKVVIPNKQLTPATRDSLRNGSLTKDLNFL